MNTESRLTSIAVWSLVLASSLAMATATRAAVYFTEDFSDNSPGPNMALGVGFGTPTTDFTDAFTVTSGDLSRIYLGTNDTDYSSVNFVFEATVTMPAGTSPWSSSFFGMGHADSDPDFYGEPLSPYALMAMRLDGGGLINKQDNGAATLLERPSDIESKTHRMRMEWYQEAQLAAFHVDKDYSGGPFVSDLDFIVDGSDNGFDAANSQLFVGGGGGVSFGDLAVSAGPLPGKIRLEIDRQTGEMALDNLGDEAVDLLGYSIRSQIAAVDPSQWTTVAGNYDATGDGQIDSDNDWTVLTNTTAPTYQDLSEAELEGGDGGSITAAAAPLSLGNAWVRNPREDVAAEILLTDGQTVQAPVQFTGDPLIVGDLDFDGLMTNADWGLFKLNMLEDLSELTIAQQYNAGDLNGDGKNNVQDFGLFKGQFDALNGPGAFAGMVAGVPEPCSWLLLVLGGLLLLSAQRKVRTNMKANMIAVTHLGVILAIAISVSISHAATVSTFTGGDPGEGLDLDGAFLYAIDSGGNGQGLADTTVRDAMFVVDYDQGGVGQHVPGVIAFGTLASPWATAPNYGTSADDDALERIMSDILYTMSTASGARADYVMQVTAGQHYKLQAILNENYWGSGPGGLGEREQDVLIYSGEFTDDPVGDGRTIYDHAFNVNVVDIVGAANTLNTGVVVTMDFVPQEDVVTVWGRLPDNPDPTLDHNAIFNAVTLEQVFSEEEILKLSVNRTTGAVMLAGAATDDLTIDYLQITSDADSLNAAGWTGLGGQPGFPAGDGNGNGWEKVGVPDADSLAEAYLHGTSPVVSGTTVPLGSAYDTSVDAQDVEFLYRLADGQTRDGLVEYVTGGFPLGDVNQDGVVNGLDVDPFVGVLLGGSFQVEADMNEDELVNGLDVDLFVATVIGGGVQAVPEPSTLVLLSLAGLMILSLRRSFQERGLNRP